jgi:hypothetical protein
VFRIAQSFGIQIVSEYYFSKLNVKNSRPLFSFQCFNLRGKASKKCVRVKCRYWLEGINMFNTEEQWFYIAIHMCAYISLAHKPTILSLSQYRSYLNVRPIAILLYLWNYFLHNLFTIYLQKIFTNFNIVLTIAFQLNATYTYVCSLLVE